VRAALVGTGRIARQHLGALARLPGVEVAAVCDVSAASVGAAAERFGIARPYTDHRAMLAEVRPDVTHVTTPADTHLGLALDAIEAGSHVVVEKPAARDLAELEGLLERAEAAGRVVVETYNYLFNEPVRRMLELVAAGNGEVVHVAVTLCLDIAGPDSPFADRNRRHPALAFPGGAISDFLPHLASLAHAFAGEHRAAHAVWSRRDAAGTLPADELRALVDGARATAVVCFSGNARPDLFAVDVLAPHMRMSARLFEPRLVVERIHAVPKPLNPVANGLAEAAETARGAVGGLARKLGGGPGSLEGLWTLVERTYAALAAGGPPPVSHEQMRAVHRLVGALTANAPVS
jgi:predicted dehydrogenase